MNKEQLIHNLALLKLPYTAEHLNEYLAHSPDLGPVLETLFSLEAEAKTKRVVANNIQLAKFPYNKRIKDFDFDFQPSINNEVIWELATMKFLKHHDNVLFIGNSGVGKTHLATRIGIAACEANQSAYFITCQELVSKLISAYREQKLNARLGQYARYKLLIIDEVDYLPVDKLGADLLFQLINRRYERRSTIITTNTPLSEWGHVFGDEALANAILDRLVHHAKIIKISGQSYRMREYRETTQTKESKSTKKQLRMKRGQTG